MAVVHHLQWSGSPQKLSLTFSIVSPSFCREVMGPDVMFLVLWMLSCKPTFSLFSFTFIKRLFSSSLLSTIRVVSSVYLRLLIFLLAIFIPACASSSLAFHMIYSAHKLNKQGDNNKDHLKMYDHYFWHLFFHVSGVFNRLKKQVNF